MKTINQICSVSTIIFVVLMSSISHVNAFNVALTNLNVSANRVGNQTFEVHVTFDATFEEVNYNPTWNFKVTITLVEENKILETDSWSKSGYSSKTYSYDKIYTIDVPNMGDNEIEVIVKANAGATTHGPSKEQTITLKGLVGESNLLLAGIILLVLGFAVFIILYVKKKGLPKI